ncbi:iripin-2 [Lepeophtheirus salmonis]|uniref:iripin-2 n=1 Tax=Lepeophtheirus salmonis TaxID=72036 RepID=UPI001AE5AA27|nr:serine protease inhibitor 2.1-like [Lepeophtheirus salmonis]
MSDSSVEETIELIGRQSIKFGLQLFKKITDSHENAVFSSYSAYSILMLSYLGAKKKTFRELKKVLGLPQDLEYIKSAYLEICNKMKSDENMVLNVVNAMFLSNKLTLNPEFVESVAHYFKSSIQHLNFKDYEDSITEDTTTIFVNAIYFEGVWPIKFESKNTSERDFHVSPTRTIKIPTMYATDIKFTTIIDKKLNCIIAALPYEGDRMTMYLLLPENKFGLPDLLKKVKSDKFDYPFLDNDENAITKPIYLPKFELESSFNLNVGLESMGLTNIFNDHSDLSGIAGDPGELKVDQIVQNAKINVNERGTKGAAATGMATFVFHSAPIRPPPLVIDHPFMFFIKDSLTGIILFIGKVVDPSFSHSI